MHLYELLAVLSYFAVLLGIGIISYQRHLSAEDFIIGKRSLNYWLTALAAHASDMSSWLFLGYPAMVFALGMGQIWCAVGLVLFMFLNWQWIAPKVRVATERYGSLTFSSFFESRLGDRSGTIRVFTALMSLVFYTIYISAGLVGLGHLLECLFGVNYFVSICVGLLVVIPYVFIGGYRTLAWIDFFQGIFLMLVILFVPLYLLPKVGGWEGVMESLRAKDFHSAFLPTGALGSSAWKILLMVVGWGLGYFGQPHIVTKFMGIRDVKEIAKSKMVGMSWMVLSLGAATLVGLVGVPLFKEGIANPEHLFILMVQNAFPAFFVGLILCAVFAATINAMSSQVLVLSSSLTEDFYKKLCRSGASSRELLLVSRVGVILVAVLAFVIASCKVSTIYSLVLYAWSGLGASFGPLLILCLYSKRVNRYGAWCGILSGGVVAGVWPMVAREWNVPALVPAFFISFGLIVVVSRLTEGSETREVKRA